MKLFLVRHGQTKWRKIGFLSYTDLELIKKGISQAKKIALKLKSEKIDRIYSSPLKRCRQTAEIVGKELGLKVFLAPELKEVNFGIFEGLSLEEAKKKYPELFLARQRDKWNFRIPRGESYKDAAKRVLKFLKKLSDKKIQNVILITHVTIIKILLRLFSNLSMEEIDQIRFSPTSLTILERKNKKFRVLAINDISHLKL
jgi:broad specificity phosphatase PhoE